MTLARHTLCFLAWLRITTARLIKIDRRATVTLVVSMVANQLATMLALLLPLKVILLVGSEGVPSYFQFLMTEETRDLWVGILVAATFGAFLFSQYLQSVIARHSTRGATTLIRSADQVPIASNEDEITESTFHRVCDTTANLIFALLALAAGLALAVELFLAILILLVIQFVFVDRILGDLHSGSEVKTSAARYVQENTTKSLSFLRTFDFLIVFVLLLVAFFIFSEFNRLIAIASIILSRRLFGSISEAFRNGIKLTKDRSRADALIFPQARLAESLRGQSLEFEGRFGHSIRLQRVRAFAQPGDQFGSGGGGSCDLESFDLESLSQSVWVDSGSVRFTIFDLYGPGGLEFGERLYREYVYTPAGTKGLEQHDYLLERLNAAQLRSLHHVGSYREGGYVGRVVEYRSMQAIGPQAWAEARHDVLRHFWNLELDDDLVGSFTSARLLIHERVSDTVLPQLRIAADEPWAAEAYEELAGRLEDLCRRLGESPVALMNHRLNHRNAVLNRERGVLLLDWTSWGVEPVGVGFDPETDGSLLLRQAAIRMEANNPKEAGQAASDALAAGLLYHLETLVRRGRPKHALRVAHDSLPLLSLPNDELITALDTGPAPGRLDPDDSGWEADDELTQPDQDYRKL